MQEINLEKIVFEVFRDCPDSIRNLVYWSKAQQKDLGCFGFFSLFRIIKTLEVNEISGINQGNKKARAEA